MCTSCMPKVDAARVDAFAERMVAVLNGGALALMISLGHRTGLFDAMAEMPPADSPAIAARAGLNERYVREWLGAMVTGKIVDYDPARRTYSLPAEHAACLTRAAAPNNIAAFAQYVPQLGSVEDRIVACFRNGGGVPYSGFARFHEIMAEESGQIVGPALLDYILSLAPGLTGRLEAGIDVLDLGCGSGRALAIMAEAFPASRFTGYDFSKEAIGRARAEAKQRGLRNLRFEVEDAATIDEDEAYDLITTFDAVHDQARPAVVLRNIFEALKPDGVYLMQDIAGSSEVHNNMDHPIGPFLYTVSCMHCMTVSLSQDGDGLGAMWGEEKALEMLAEAGFESVRVESLPHDAQNSYFIVRKRKKVAPAG